MVTYDILKQIGISKSGLVRMGKILGTLKMLSEFEETTSKTLKGYSWEIALDISETLLSKIDSEMIKNYLRDPLVHWVSHSLNWSKEGLSFNVDVLIVLPKSEFEKLKFTKDEFRSYLRKVWVSEENPHQLLAKLSDLPDTDRDVKFFFNLQES